MIDKIAPGAYSIPATVGLKSCTMKNSPKFTFGHRCKAKLRISNDLDCVNYRHCFYL